MIHKFLILLAFFCGLICQELYGQNQKKDSLLSRFYLKISAGYGIGINGEYLRNANNGNVTNTISKLGNGLYYNASVDYQYNKNIGVELGIGYENGLINNELPHDTGYYSALKSGNMWQITPSIVFSTTVGRFAPYIRTGMIIGSPEVFMETVNNRPFGPNQPNLDDSKLKLYGGLATGFQAALGCNILLKNHKWIVFAEASFNDIGFLPEKGSVYSQTLNGVDQLPKLSVSEKEEIFTKSYSYNAHTPSQPTTLPENKLPFGGLAFNLGLKMNIRNFPKPYREDYFVQHFFVRVNLGYGFAANGDVNYSVSDNSYKAINVSYGNGINEGFGLAFMFNECIGFDLGLNYVASSTIKAVAGGTLTQNIYQTGNQTSEYGNMIQVNPSFVIATHIHKLLPYARLGMLIGSGNVYYAYEDNHALLNGGYFDRQSILKFYGGTSLGYSAVLGSAYWINYTYDLFAEACFNSIYDIPEKAQMIKDNYNGTSNLGNETTNEKNTIFKSSYNTNSASDQNSPTVSSPIKFSFDAVVFRIGVRMWLRKHHKSG